MALSMSYQVRQFNSLGKAQDWITDMAATGWYLNTISVAPTAFTHAPSMVYVVAMQKPVSEGGDYR